MPTVEYWPSFVVFVLFDKEVVYSIITYSKELLANWGIFEVEAFLLYSFNYFSASAPLITLFNVIDASSLEIFSDESTIFLEITADSLNVYYIISKIIFIILFFFPFAQNYFFLAVALALIDSVVFEE